MMARTVRGEVCELLLRCEAAGQYANIALDTALARSGLTGADRGLFTALFYSVIEHRITLDHIIDRLASLPPSGIERRVRMILRLGLCQLLYFDRIPDHAAIDESVELSPRRTKGFVNAILRQFCRTGKQILPPARGQDPEGYLSVCYSVPRDLVAELCRVFGAEGAERELAALSEVKGITVRVNTSKHSRAEWLATYGGEPCRFAPHGVHIKNTEHLQEWLDKGLCFVQDEASQICVAALDAAGHDVLDLCAAPGSKSFGAALSGARTVRSFDLHENKLSLIRRGAQALGLANIEVAAADARTASPERYGLFERVICDVPCSGYGVLAKKPDIRYKPVSAGAGLPAIQRDILSAAANCVAPGGVLVYSTCTLLPAENEEQIERFLAEREDFSLVPFTVGELETSGQITLTPARHGTDGFFIAKLQKG